MGGNPMMACNHDAHVVAWSAVCDARQHRAHVAEWVKHHARRFADGKIRERYRPDALHEYTDPDNNPLHWRIRLKHPDTGAKWVRPMMRTGAGFSLKQPDYPNGTPLFRLHELANQPDAPIWIVEGETCADALADIGLLATTSGSADSAGKADWSILRGRTVHVWPDNDEAGQRYGQAVRAELEAIGCDVTVIDVAALDLPPKGDCVDWLALNPNASAADVDALVKGVKVAKVAGVAAVSEPEPLRAALLPAEPYPVEMLGDILGGAAKALHDSVKAPLAMCCQSVLAAASLAVQPHYDIKLPWGERKPLSLFMLTVGESGERKSGIDDLVLGAAKAQERADMEVYAHEQERYEADMAAWNQASDTARKATKTNTKGAATAADIRAAVERCGEKPVAPVAPIRFVTDPTVEGLYKLLVVGQPSVALFSDEGGLLIGGHALNSDNALKTMARWCKLWDGSPFDRVRAGDGAGILYGRRMALHQLAQPDVMIKLLSDRMANGQGLLARCLVAWPESTIGNRYVDSFEWAGDRKELKRLFAVLKGLMESQPRVGNSYQELDPIELPLSDGAKEMAVAAGNKFESLMARGADLAELRDRTSKALENACRIAGVLAVVDGGLATRIIEVEHLQRALALIQWYLAEALRIRGATSVSQSVIDAEALSTWLKERGITSFRSKQILNAGPNQLRNKPRLMASINELVSCGYLDVNQPGTVVDGVAARASWRVLHHVV